MRLAVANAMLRAELETRVATLREQRARIVADGDAGRRRVERDVHDGAQQGLLATLYDLQLAAASAPDPERASTLDDAAARLGGVLDELRELAHGIHPTILAQAGLRPALASLASNAPIPVEIAALPDGRYAPEAELAAYRFLDEAVRNAAEHAAPSAIVISVCEVDGTLVVRAADDGRGGATLGEAGGLAELADRVGTRGGTLELTSPPGHGTTIEGVDPVRVVIADDALVTREGIPRLLADAGVEVAALTGDADELLHAVGAHGPDAAIVDIRMPPTHTDEGLRAAKRIRTEYPATAVLVLSSYLEAEFAAGLLEHGAGHAGYLLKDRVRHVAVLVDALRRITEGETVVDSAIVTRLMTRRRRDDPLAELTAREREILGLIAEGYSNGGIARRLVVTERTVESHIRQVLAKLGVPDDHTHNRRVLAVLAWLRSG